MHGHYSLDAGLLEPAAGRVRALQLLFRRNATSGHALHAALAQLAHQRFFSGHASESSLEMTSAATFFPAKLTCPVSGDLKVEVNVTAAECTTTAATAMAAAANRAVVHRCLIRLPASLRLCA
jgi:hypothetical protein